MACAELEAAEESFLLTFRVLSWFLHQEPSLDETSFEPILGRAPCVYEVCCCLLNCLTLYAFYCLWETRYDDQFERVPLSLETANKIRDTLRVARQVSICPEVFTVVKRMFFAPDTRFVQICFRDGPQYLYQDRLGNPLRYSKNDVIGIPVGHGLKSASVLKKKIHINTFEIPDIIKNALERAQRILDTLDESEDVHELPQSVAQQPSNIAQPNTSLDSIIALRQQELQRPKRTVKKRYWNPSGVQQEPKQYQRRKTRP